MNITCTQLWDQPFDAAQEFLDDITPEGYPQLFQEGHWRLENLTIVGAGFVSDKSYLSVTQAVVHYDGKIVCRKAEGGKVVGFLWAGGDLAALRDGFVKRLSELMEVIRKNHVGK